MVKLMLSGVVVKDAVDKTVKVRVTRSVMHTKYRKIIRRIKDYLVHDEHNQCKAGEKVSMEICKPLSRRKKWSIIHNN